MSRGLLLGLWALVIVAGCASTKGEVRGALDTAIVAKEVTESGEVRDIPAEGISEVDVNSSVVLAMNGDAIRAAAPVSVGERESAQKLKGDLAMVAEALRAQLA